MTLTYTDETHAYSLDGRRVVNVTSILSGGLPKGALVNWAARSVAEYVATEPEAVEAMRSMGWEPMVKALSAVPDQRRDEAAKRGTKFHDLAEIISGGDLVHVPPALADMARGFVHWLDRFNPEVVLTETAVASRRYRYAGRLDMLAYVTTAAHGRRLCLLDVKTSRAVYGDTALQCAAYARAEFYVDEAGAEVPVPEVDGMGVIHVTDQGTELYDLGPIEPAWSEFLACLATYRGTQRRRNLLGLPAEPAGEPDVPLFTLESA